MVVRNLDLSTVTVGELRERVRSGTYHLVIVRNWKTLLIKLQDMKTQSGWKPYQNVQFGRHPRTFPIFSSVPSRFRRRLCKPTSCVLALRGTVAHFARENVSDTLKLYSKAKGTKTQNLIINLDNDPEWMFEDDGKTLADVGCGQCDSSSITLRALLG
jgi:hypothetical protein